MLTRCKSFCRASRHWLRRNWGARIDAPVSRSRFCLLRWHVYAVRQRSQTISRGIHKVRPQIAPGPFALARYIRCAKECQLLAAAFRSSQVIGAGTHVVLTRGCHRAAFGTATRARPCRHPFFMLRFLAGASAGTDGSFTGRAGRGLGLSRRNERRTEERHSDKSRDCKFGSHKKVSPKVTGCQQQLDALCADPMFGRWRMFGK